MIKVTSVLAADLERDLTAIAAVRGKIIAVTPATFAALNGGGGVQVPVVASYLVVSGHRAPKPVEPEPEDDLGGE